MSNQKIACNIRWDNSSNNSNLKMNKTRFNQLMEKNLKSKQGYLTGPYCSGWVIKVLENVGIVLPRADAWDLFTYIRSQELRFGKDGIANNPFIVNGDNSQLSSVKNGLLFGTFPNTTNFASQALQAVNNSPQSIKDLIKKHEGGNLVGMTHVGIVWNGNFYHLLGNASGTNVTVGLTAGFKPIAWWGLLDAIYNKLP